MMIFLLASQKNNTALMDSWSPDVLEMSVHDISYNGNEIKDVVWAELFKRYPAYTKKDSHEVR
jgi:hypothetical protein